jgi:hypothetical protein
LLIQVEIFLFFSGLSTAGRAYEFIRTSTDSGDGEGNTTFFAFVFVIAVILIVVGAGGFFIYRKMSEPSGSTIHAMMQDDEMTKDDVMTKGDDL